MQFFLMANCFVFGVLLTGCGVISMVVAIVGEISTPKRQVLWAVGGFVAVQAGLALIATIPSLT